MSGSTSKRYPAELRERAVRMVTEIRSDHESDWAAMTKVAELLGVRDAGDDPEVVSPGRGRCRSAARADERGVGRAEAVEAGER